MRLAIYVPKAQAEGWSNDEGSITFNEFQTRVVNITGGVTLTSATGRWQGKHGHVAEPVFVVETLLRIPSAREYRAVWDLFRTYATQLIAQGEESVLIVQDHEPTLITA